MLLQSAHSVKPAQFWLITYTQHTKSQRRKRRIRRPTRWT